MSFFGGNPFATTVGQLIEQATDGSLASENWTLNMEICDIINGSNEAPKDAVKAIKKRLSLNVGKNYTIIMYTLTVLETCVKNCSVRFHVLIAHKDFLQEFMKIISPKNDPPQVVQEKVLSLIQTWADAFKGRSEMKEINKIYTDLKAKGIEFPMTDMDHMVPIHTPARTQMESSPPPPDSRQPTTGVTAGYGYTPAQQPVQFPPGGMQQAAPAMSSIVLQPEQQMKLRKELDVTQQNCKVFSEMLTELKPGQASTQDMELLNELNRTCRQMQQRIMQLLETVSNEDVTEELLRINDYLNNVFIRYDRFDRNCRTQTPNTETDQSNVDTLPIRQPAPAATETVTTPNLIDLETPTPHAQTQDPFMPVTADSDLQARLASMNVGNDSVSSTLDNIDTTTATASRASAAPSIGDEEFDMFAQARQSFDHGKQTIQQGGTGVYQNQQADLYPGGLNSAVQAKADENSDQPSGRNADYDEMTQWLEGDGGVKPQESATSSEFDRFLADRAREADSLPDVPRANRQLQKDDKDNAMFAL